MLQPPYAGQLFGSSNTTPTRSCPSMWTLTFVAPRRRRRRPLRAMALRSAGAETKEAGADEEIAGCRGAEVIPMKDAPGL